MAKEKDSGTTCFMTRSRTSTSPKKKNPNGAAEDGEGGGFRMNCVRRFEKHEGETEGQVGRLEQVFEVIGQPPKARPAMPSSASIEEGQEIMKEYKGTPALGRRPDFRRAGGRALRDRALRHAEAWGGRTRPHAAVKLLDATLAEEKNTDASLSKLAETVINQQAEAA